MNPFIKIAYQPYKWIIIIPFLFTITLVLGLICIFTGLLLKQDAANIIAVIWAKLCCAIVPLNIIIKGKKKYNRNKSYVVVANHQSMADIPVIHGHLGLNIKWIMKKELGKIPIFGSACHQLGCIYIDRANHDAAIKTIREAQKKISRKASVLFFAEGTRSRDGNVMPFKKGAFRFAIETGLPILPITIKNSIHVLPSDSLDLTPGNIEIIVHHPIHIAKHHMDHLDEIIEHTRRTISKAL
ncbi:MAG: 1-acyl-sn-glycerol-3-phosphate acyltransferase [Desulfobacula sp.]|uniref:lysophospholipid acyltransferase family protein n=1 Tax=Desulfobacula sp. TaxID=2593537 RepID=UPI0025BF77F4|nr:lysophospholipid acyltransferase family protein [Desulfobacula sp.]MCD4722748.1 1-acyl-sn-glycerol-3-phosphate acyltransferase [Desulfobacula sp.]